MAKKDKDKGAGTENEKKKTQLDLHGKKLEIRETKETKTYIRYVASSFCVRASVESFERASEMDKDDREKWLKAKMRPLEDMSVTGSDFDRDYNALSAFVFGL